MKQIPLSKGYVTLVSDEDYERVSKFKWTAHVMRRPDGAAVNQSSPTFEVAVEGTPRSLHPILRDEVYRLVAEALRNAFCHAQAGKIEVEIRYGEKEFRLQVRDNGRGIDPSVLSGDGREGHYGLHGMHERAKLAGGKLRVWSELNSGTEVELSIPALGVYAQPPRSLRLLQKLSRKDKERQEKV
jgi:signal transduction histidine kinase